MQTNSPKILIVEDDLLNRKLTALYVERLGYQIDLVVNGLEAVTAVTTGLYALVLMDCQMPVMDGLEATAQIRQLEQKTQRYTPIVAVTSNVGACIRDECIAAGMDDYLTKPVQPELLKLVINYWISKAMLS